MASSSSSSLSSLLLFFLLLSVTAQRSSSSFLLPVTKDPLTLQYLTTVFYGNFLVPWNLVLDLGAPSLWVDCASGFASSSINLVPNRAIQCLAAKGSAHFFQNEKPMCGVPLENGIAGVSAAGELVEGFVNISTNMLWAEPEDNVQSFLFSCAPRILLQGLAISAKGMLGLGRARISLPSQLSPHRQFSVCLSSSDGFVSASISDADVSKSLIYTPLFTNQNEDYLIRVKSLRINGQKVSLKSPVETKLSTVVPFSIMQTSIYTIFTEAFMRAAAAMNMNRVDSIIPFEFCFKNEEIEPLVPEIDLVLQSEMVKWRMNGRNSMVRVNKEVICLGVLDGGLNPEASIVLGGHQLEENLLQFDLGTSMLGFNSLTSKRQASCSSLQTSSLRLSSL